MFGNVMRQLVGKITRKHFFNLTAPVGKNNLKSHQDSRHAFLLVSGGPVGMTSIGIPTFEFPLKSEL